MIDILMATYNGERFLDLQIFSLINQTYSDWNLYIHDDGSTDNTVSVIKKWSEHDKRIHLVDDGIKHLGPGNNFFHLIPYAKSEYVCFCDQDDFWFEYKLSEYVDFMKGHESSRPFCAIFSAYIWSRECISPFLHEQATSLNRVLFTGGTQGCSIVFNNALAQKTVRLSDKNIFLHDYVVVLLAVLYGEVQYVQKKLMLYRQHDANVTAHMPKSKIEKIVRGIKENSNSTFLYPKMHEDIEVVFKAFKSEISDKDKRLFERYLSLPAYSKFKRFWKLCFSDFSIGSHSRFYFLIKFLLRKKYK